MFKHWCMCTVLCGVARDGWSTCYICGGKDAYGSSPERGGQFKKVLAEDQGAATNVPITAVKSKPQAETGACDNYCRGCGTEFRCEDKYCPKCGNERTSFV